MSQVTRILTAIERGDPSASEKHGGQLRRFELSDDLALSEERGARIALGRESATPHHWLEIQRLHREAKMLIFESQFSGTADDLPTLPTWRGVLDAGNPAA